ncbi:hypothetical protein JCM5353_000064 [Sporobolomyces roseus]
MASLSSVEIDYVVLVTSDDDSIRHTISRSVLTSFSTVFRDLLSLPLISNSPSSNEIPMTETDLEIKGFWRMLESIEKGEEADLADFEVEDWEKLAKLSDKYDSLIAKMRVKSYIWECMAKDWQHETRFYLAVAIEDVELIGRTSVKAIQSNWYLSDKVPQEWQLRIVRLSTLLYSSS